MTFWIIYAIGVVVGMVASGYAEPDGEERWSQPLVLIWPLVVPILLVLFVLWALTEFGASLRRRMK